MPARRLGITPGSFLVANLSRVLLLAVFGCFVAAGAAAQSAALPDAPSSLGADSSQPAPETERPVTIGHIPADILQEQAAIWTSPAHLHNRNLVYLVPLAVATALAITTDHQVMSSARLNDTSLNNHANTASNGLLGVFVAAPVAIYAVGHMHGDSDATATGILGGEAMVDSLVVDEVLKAATMRERPTLDSAKGKFFQTSVGMDSSFPSTHSMLAWSSAAVIATEYPRPLVQIAAYGLASGVSLTRVLGKQHFPSDVLVGSAVGWMVGRYVAHRHHHRKLEN